MERERRVGPLGVEPRGAGARAPEVAGDRPERPDEFGGRGEAATAARAALDRLRRFGGDRLVRDMAGIFHADMPERLDRARAAVAAGDAGAVAYAAHTMKSSAAQFGAAALTRVCGEAERAARAGDLAALRPLVDGMARELAGYRAWLEGELGGAAREA